MKLTCPKCKASDDFPQEAIEIGRFARMLTGFASYHEEKCGADVKVTV